MPPYTAHCTKCRRRRLVDEMVVETNKESQAYGFYVCPEPHTVGGCFDGPYPDLTRKPMADDLGPIDHIL